MKAGGEDCQKFRDLVQKVIANTDEYDDTAVTKKKKIKTAKILTVNEKYKRKFQDGKRSLKKISVDIDERRALILANPKFTGLQTLLDGHCAKVDQILNEASTCLTGERCRGRGPDSLGPKRSLWDYLRI